MKDSKLDLYEKGILDAFSAGKLESVEAIEKEISRYRQYARQTLDKTKSINNRHAAGGSS